MQSSKRNAAPVPPSDEVQNPFRKIFAAAGILLLLVLSVPMFADALYGQPASALPVEEQSVLLMSTINDLRAEISALKADVAAMRLELAAQSGTSTAQTVDAGE